MKPSCETILHDLRPAYLAISPSTASLVKNLIAEESQTLPSPKTIESNCFCAYSSLPEIPLFHVLNDVSSICTMCTHPFLALSYKRHLYLNRSSHLGRFLELEMVNKAIYYF